MCIKIARNVKMLSNMANFLLTTNNRKHIRQNTKWRIEVVKIDDTKKKQRWNWKYPKMRLNLFEMACRHGVYSYVIFISTVTTDNPLRKKRHNSSQMWSTETVGLDVFRQSVLSDCLSVIDVRTLRFFFLFLFSIHLIRYTNLYIAI